MHRRAFLTGTVAALAGLDAAWAQPGKVARIGRLSPLSAASEAPFMAAFRAGLRDVILAGSSPGTLAAKQATRSLAPPEGNVTETARVLGLTFPHSLVLRADQVLQ